MRVLICLLAILAASEAFAAQRIYLSARGDSRLEIYDFNASDGSLTLQDSVELKGNPGNTVVSPDQKYIYASVSTGNRARRENGIETLQIQPDGAIRHVGYAPTPYRCGFLSLDRTGTTLFSSHYSEGRITSYQLQNGIFKGTLLDDIQTDDRAHCIRVDRTNSYVFVPHTSPNKVYQFGFNDGKLTPLIPAYADGPDADHRYHEPRHFVFHPNQDFIYTSNERGGGLSHWSYDKTGRLALKQTVSTLPNNAHEKFAASDITISADGRFVYVANRDGLNPKAANGGDCIAAFALDKSTGEIKHKIGSYKIGRHPRCLRIDNSGKFLFGPGVNSSTLTVYRIDQGNGSLVELKVYSTGAGPMWILCL